MSWSVSATGTPNEITKRLEEYGAALSDQSKVEFDAAKPHLLGLVHQNFDNAGREEEKQPKLALTAYGSGYCSTGEQVQRQCSVTINRG